MPLRLPRPLKALSSLRTAWEDPRVLHRLQYGTDTGERGVLLWTDNDSSPATILSNTTEVYIPEDKSFIIDRKVATEINGETIPVYELAVASEIDNSDEKENVDIPDEIRGQYIPPVDRLERNPKEEDFTDLATVGEPTDPFSPRQV